MTIFSILSETFWCHLGVKSARNGGKTGYFWLFCWYFLTRKPLKYMAEEVRFELTEGY